MPVRLLVFAVFCALLVPAGASPAGPQQLVGDVGAGDAFRITLVDATGARVTHLDPGTYTLLVHDRSSIHDFHLTGPGVDVATDVDFTGDETFTVTFSDGAYRYVCDPHSTVMRGTFTVGTAPQPPAPTDLSGRVGPGKTISLRAADGSKLAAPTPGAFVVHVRDRSRTDDFHLAGPGVNRATGVGFRGSATWKVTLRAGRYTYRSDRHKRLHGGFTVSASSAPG